MRSDFQTAAPFARIAFALKEIFHALGLGPFTKNLLRRAGFELRYVGAITPAAADPDIRHSQVWPFATYSPWLTTALSGEFTMPSSPTPWLITIFPMTCGGS